MIANIPRVLDYMERCGLRAVIASAPANVYYLTGYSCWIDPLFQEWMMKPGGSCEVAQRYAVLTHTGRIGLVVGPAMGMNAAALGLENIAFHGQFEFDTSHLDQASDLAREWVRHIGETDPASTPESALGILLHRFGVDPATAALDHHGLTDFSRHAILQHFGNPGFRNCSNLFRLARMVKTEAEIGLLRRALEISEAACASALNAMADNSSTAQTTAHYASQVAAAGAEFDHFAYSPQGLAIATSAPLNWAEIDATYVDYGCKYGNYFSDGGITLIGPRIKSGYRDTYLALKNGLAAAVSQLRPGTTASRAHHLMMDEVRRHGITRGSFPHGHGVGLEVRDYPIIVPANGLRVRDDCVDVDSDLSFESGMVINLELSHFAPGAGSMNLEATFLVTEDGAEPLAAQARETPIEMRTALGADWERRATAACN